jgi:hypothetical protein
MTSIIPEVSAQSKFQFVTAPLQQLPHKCAGCFRYDDPDCDKNGHLVFLDWNFEVEFYGKVFICVDCLREIVNQLGWATDKQVKRADNVISDLLGQVSALSVENENLRNAVGNLSIVAADRPAINFSSSSTMADFEVTDGDVADDTERVSDESISDSDVEPGINEELARQDDGEGSTDLRGDDDLNALLDSI